MNPWEEFIHPTEVYLEPHFERYRVGEIHHASDGSRKREYKNPKMPRVGNYLKSSAKTSGTTFSTTTLAKIGMNQGKKGLVKRAIVAGAVRAVPVVGTVMLVYDMATLGYWAYQELQD